MAGPSFNLNSLLNGNYNQNYQAPAPAKPAAKAAAPAAAAPAGQSIYWVGADGNVYVKGPGGNNAAVTNYGKVTGVQKANGVDAAKASVLATRVSDPNAPKPTVALTTPAAAAGASGPTPEDRSNDINQQNAGLNAVGTQVASGQAAVDTALTNLMGTYGTEADAANTSYTNNTNQNKVNLTKNQQTAFVNAAQGRQGLNGVLSSLGALNGSGIDLATRAVQKGANEDLSGASDNYATNANALDTASGAFQAANKERKDRAIRDAESAKLGVRNQGAKDTLGYYQNLSNDYAAQLDKAGAAKYSNLAASLFPTIAGMSTPSAGPTYSAASYSAPSLASYLSGNNNNTSVQATPATAATGGIPGLSAVTKKRTPFAMA